MSLLNVLLRSSSDTAMGRSEDTEAKPTPEAPAMLHGKAEPGPTLGGKGLIKPTPESLAASALAEHQPDEADAIVRVWKALLGMDLGRGKVLGQLRDLREWQDKWVGIRRGNGT